MILDPEEKSLLSERFALILRRLELISNKLVSDCDPQSFHYQVPRLILNFIA